MSAQFLLSVSRLNDPSTTKATKATIPDNYKFRDNPHIFVPKVSYNLNKDLRRNKLPDTIIAMIRISMIRKSLLCFFGSNKKKRGRFYFLAFNQ